MIDWDNLLLRHAHATLGESVRYYPAAGGSRAIAAVFNAAYTSVTLEDGLEVASTRPVLNVRASAIGVPPEPGDLWNVRGVLYQTVDIQADGLGDIRVDLRLATDAEIGRVPLPPTAPAS